MADTEEPWKAALTKALDERDEARAHRKQWRGIAARYREALEEINDPDAGPAWMRERAASALRDIDEPASQRQSKADP